MVTFWGVSIRVPIPGWSALLRDTLIDSLPVGQLGGSV